MPAGSVKILTRMLERLFASVASGPSLNARPHASRQRVDLTQFARLKDIRPADLLSALLGPEASVKLVARVPLPPTGEPVDPAKRRFRKSAAATPTDVPSDDLTTLERSAREDWLEQSALLRKVRGMIEDARIYEQDTGVHVLNVGFPLLQLPPGALGGAARGSGTRWIVAPIAFIPVSITVEMGTTPAIRIECQADEQDRVVPNEALFSWLEQQTGKTIPGSFADTTGEDPWQEICELVDRVAGILDLQAPASLRLPPVPEAEKDRQSPTPAPAADPPAPGAAAGARPPTKIPAIDLTPAPRPDDADPRPVILSAGVIGLFPASNQGLIRDTQALLAGEAVAGPIESFVRAGIDFDQPAASPSVSDSSATRAKARSMSTDRLIAACDPCQAQAVALARDHAGLVVHGPPGTGKSQTITNIIGDHLARGQRVLVVCDKRTALDVVVSRLDHMGLGKLCAIIHDPQRDQRELYRAIREQIETLPEETSNSTADKRLQKLDAELSELHTELTQYHEGLSSRDAALGLSFQDLVAKWFAASDSPGVQFDTHLAENIPPPLLETHARDLEELFTRGRAVAYTTNPWNDAAGVALSDYLAEPIAHFATKLTGVSQAYEAVDRSVDVGRRIVFSDQVDLQQQAVARKALAEALPALVRAIDPAILHKWAEATVARLQHARQRRVELESIVQIFIRGALDAELRLAHVDSLPTLSTIGLDLAALGDYLNVITSFAHFFAFKKKSTARKVVARYGLTLSPASAERVRVFLGALRARILLADYRATLIETKSSELPDDATLRASVTETQTLFDWLLRAATDPALTGLSAHISKAIRENDPTFNDALRQSHDRAQAILRARAIADQSHLLAEPWQRAVYTAACAGEPIAPRIPGLVSHFDTLEGVLRIADARSRLPDALRPAVDSLLLQAVDAHDADNLLRRHVYAAEMSRRLKSAPMLQQIDRQHLQTSFDRYRKLDADKRLLVRDVILHHWSTRQKDRLLAATGSRLNAAGADLRRRLTMRGERAMRLRRVLQVGEAIPDGDPLFDLRPVWMASPETVAQIFPRKALFDVVIFDEASQCRLEEALPVLIRGKRVVIAGDPQQLPPTRFFESALVSTEVDSPDTNEDLFETQQAEVEDLLGASLNLAIEQCYLDVHYRSRNGDLIAFSNEHFYGSRLQAIPGHPRQRTKYAPVRLERVAGIYKQGLNDIEAARVVQIIRDLLKRADPPSIGVACFNIQQRDLILEKLDDLAAEDTGFASKLAAARLRRGAGSFEGLFVKNLENVQGDERDHLIISTTYGPDESGRFYRRFGPLGRAGGGRRLNVLITRARHEVHLVTSIPAEAYRSLPPVPPDQAPGGGWLLFSYLQFAEKLAVEYARIDESTATRDAPGEVLQPASVDVHPTRNPSPLAGAYAARLARDDATGSDVHWGNEGFCIDIALHHPTQVDDVTLGILCDMTRYRAAGDPVEWDIFRTGILQQQGWELHRLWSPHFMRDPAAATREILARSKVIADATPDPDALRVEP